jgi:hypothetical protein
MALNAACGFGVDVSSSEPAVARLTKHPKILGVVGVFWVGELVDGDDVVNGVCFLSADGAGRIIFEQLASHVLEVCLVSCGGVALFVVHGFFLTPLLRCGCCRERVWLCAVIAPHSFDK